jgi:hypothetical protein
VLPEESARDRLLERLDRGGQVPERDADGVMIRDPSGNSLALAIVPERS